MDSEQPSNQQQRAAGTKTGTVLVESRPFGHPAGAGAMEVLPILLGHLEGRKEIPDFSLFPKFQLPPVAGQTQI